MGIDEPVLRDAIDRSESRLDLWKDLVSTIGARSVAEIGVYRGAFAEAVLNACPDVERYYMIDPWRHLEDWNKPANKADDVFAKFYDETMQRTEAHAAKRTVLRGRTTEVVDQIPDGSLDLAYIDGDHTLRGIAIDMHRIYPKIREGGWIAGDDFTPSIWQHKEQFEPTMVFPFAVYFAEAAGARLYALPYNQFLLEKAAGGTHEFIDLTGKYGSRELRHQVAQPVAAVTE